MAWETTDPSSLRNQGTIPRKATRCEHGRRKNAHDVVRKVVAAGIVGAVSSTSLRERRKKKSPAVGDRRRAACCVLRASRCHHPVRARSPEAKSASAWFRLVCSGLLQLRCSGLSKVTVVAEEHGHCAATPMRFSTAVGRTGPAARGAAGARETTASSVATDPIHGHIIPRHQRPTKSTFFCRPAVCAAGVGAARL